MSPSGIAPSTVIVAITALALSGCSTIVSYSPQRNANDPTQSVKYTQGVGTVTVKNEVSESYMYPAFKAQGFSEPTFVLTYANNSPSTVDFSTANVKAYFRGQPVPIYAYAEKIAQIQAEKQGKQVALAIAGALAAGAAAYGASHQTYTSNYSGTVYTPRGNAYRYSGWNTVQTYDPLAGIVVGGAIAGGTAYGINQLEYNAKNLEVAAGAILQENTLDPQRMVTGNIILRDCCDRFPKSGDSLKFEVTANGRTSTFEFARNIVTK